MEAQVADDWSTFVDSCNEAILLADEIIENEELSGGHNFAESVKEKVEGMKKWATEKEHATERMFTSAENILGGLERWLD